MERQNLQDQGVMVEYKLPLSAKRIDVVIYGHDEQQHKQAVIVELKQWEKCEFTDYDSDYVLTWVGGGHRSVLHPSIQVGNYLYISRKITAPFIKKKPPFRYQLAAICTIIIYQAMLPFRISDLQKLLNVFRCMDQKIVASFLPLSIVA